MADATLLGSLDARAELSVTILLRQRQGSPPLPDIQYWQNTPPGRRAFLSTDELAQQYGAAQADLHAVENFAKTHGMTVVESHPGRRHVIVRGTAAQMNAAFGIELNQYQAPLRLHPHGIHPDGGAGAQGEGPTTATQVHRGFEGTAQLPSELTGIVSAVIGLDNRQTGSRAGSGTGDPPSAALLTVPQLAGLYNFPSTGAKDQTIGVFAPNPAAYLLSDINGLYFPSLPKPFSTPPTVIDVNLTVDGTTYTNNPASVKTLGLPLTSALAQNCTELTQDISTSSTLMQGGTINVYFTENTEQGWAAFLSRAIIPNPGDHAPSVLTASWLLSFGDDSGSIGDPTSSGSTAQVLSNYFQLAALAGITVFIALGDWGADDQVTDTKCHTSYPSSDPWVVSCGGTVIGITSPGPPPVWQEQVWSDAFSASPFGKTSADFGATGGGVSDNFGLPAYQAAAKLTPVSKNDGAVRRGVPDVAGMVALRTFFLNAIPYSFIGTSCVAPLYAGLTAVLNSALGAPIGLLHPTLYGKTIVCKDVTFGNNDSGDTPDSPFYTAGAGWDSCTGMGSIDGTKLLTALAAVEEATPVNPNNPFNFPCNFPPSWMIGQGQGANDTNDGLSVGQQNTADNYGTPSSPYDPINGGDGSGPDFFGDVTLLNTAVGYGATFAGDNIYSGKGSIGVFGRSRGNDFSMGVLGQSSKGSAVYGLATDDQPITPPVQPSHGIGVVGRSMGGVEPERISVERMVGEPVGVLGHATTGPGVRGHSGPLFTPPVKGPGLPPVLVASPGGVFSSGRLQREVLFRDAAQKVSLDALPQLRLVPSIDAKLPSRAQVGDLYLVVKQTSDSTFPARLYVCTALSTSPTNPVPQWQQVQLGPSQAGGTSI
jgi:kumamolisin